MHAHVWKYASACLRGAGAGLQAWHKRRPCGRAPRRARTPVVAGVALAEPVVAGEARLRALRAHHLDAVEVPAAADLRHARLHLPQAGPHRPMFTSKKSGGCASHAARFGRARLRAAELRVPRIIGGWPRQPVDHSPHSQRLYVSEVLRIFIQSPEHCATPLHDSCEFSNSSSAGCRHDVWTHLLYKHAAEGAQAVANVQRVAPPRAALKAIPVLVVACGCARSEQQH